MSTEESNAKSVPFPELGMFWVSVWIWPISRQRSLTIGPAVFVLDLTYLCSAVLSDVSLQCTFSQTSLVWNSTPVKQSQENIFPSKNQHFASFPCVNQVNKKKCLMTLHLFWKRLKSPPTPPPFSFLFLYWIPPSGCFNLLSNCVPVFTCIEENANTNVSET